MRPARTQALSHFGILKHDHVQFDLAFYPQSVVIRA